LKRSTNFRIKHQLLSVDNLLF